MSQKTSNTTQNILVTKFPHASTFGGEEIYTIGLLEGIEQKGFKPFLLSSCKELLKKFKNRNWHNKKIWLSDEPITKKSTVIFLLTSPYLFIKIFFELLKYRFLYKTKILYCLTFGEKLIGFIPAKILGYKIIWVELVSLDHWLKSNPLRFFYKFYSKWVQIIVPCELLKTELDQNKVQKKNIKIISQGIDAAKYDFSEKETKEKPAIKDHFEIGTVLRLSKEKGAGYILQAVKQANQIIPNIQLTIVTDVSEKNNLTWLCKQLQIEHIVKIVNLQKDIKKWFADFDVFVLSSKREYISLSILEAMACGVPVIADESCGFAEIIQNNVSGLLVDTSNPEKISEAIIYLYNNPEKRKQFMIEAYKKVTTRYTQKKMIEDFYELLNK